MSAARPATLPCFKLGAVVLHAVDRQMTRVRKIHFTAEWNRALSLTNGVTTHDRIESNRVSPPTVISNEGDCFVLYGYPEGLFGWAKVDC